MLSGILPQGFSVKTSSWFKSKRFYILGYINIYVYIYVSLQWRIVAMYWASCARYLLRISVWFCTVAVWKGEKKKGKKRLKNCVLTCCSHIPSLKAAGSSREGMSLLIVYPLWYLTGVSLLPGVPNKLCKPNKPNQNWALEFILRRGGKIQFSDF